MKVILCILDGCNPQDFKKVIDKNAKTSQFFKQLAGGFYAHSITGFPTVTINEHATIMTGTYPSKHGIPGIAWFDREFNNRVKYHPGTLFQLRRNGKDVITDFILDLNISHLEPAAKTIFEILRSKKTVSVKEFIARGAQSYAEPTVSWLVNKLKLKRKNFMDLLDYWYQRNWSNCTPDLLVYWKAGTDIVSHEDGPHTPELRAEVKKGLDRCAEAVNFYRSKNEEVFLFIVADHSQTRVTERPFHLREYLKKRTKGISFANLYKLDEVYNKDAVVIGNGRSAYIYVLPKEPKRHNGVIRDILDALMTSKQIDLVFYKQTQSQIMVADPSKPDHRYKIEQFPFHKRKYPENDKIYPGEEMYPNACARVKGLLVGSNNPGDIIVSLKEGWSTAKHKGDHGSLARKDSVVPLLVHKFTSKPRHTTKKEKQLHVSDRIVQNIDVAPTIAKLFRKSFRESEGIVIKEIIERYGY
jgi:predicted AlkP superfamily pyrophosphatase or phosphodiesterase